VNGELKLKNYIRAQMPSFAHNKEEAPTITRQGPCFAGYMETFFFY
jgi:hypothetical protein